MDNDRKIERVRNEINWEMRHRRLELRSMETKKEHALKKVTFKTHSSLLITCEYCEEAEGGQHHGSTDGYALQLFMLKHYNCGK